MLFPILYLSRGYLLPVFFKSAISNPLDYISEDGNNFVTVG